MQPTDTAGSEAACPMCGARVGRGALGEAAWVSDAVVARLADQHPAWTREDGGCPACVQEALLAVLLHHGDNAFHASVQSVWPLDSETAFGAIPTPLRLHADQRFTGRGITVAFVDAGFFPHPDVVEPVNRVCSWADASEPDVKQMAFEPVDLPRWPGWDAQAAGQWHGLMTTTAACGNGTLSRGFYRGLAPEARLVLVQVAGGSGHIGNPAIARALRWLGENASRLGVRVVSLSLGGDAVPMDRDNEVDREVAALVERGIVVIAAAGNKTISRISGLNC